MLKRSGIAILFLLLILCLACTAYAEDTLDITLNQGERWIVPADRLGACTLSDSGAVAVEDGALVGLKPGRAEVRMSGARPTLFRVLVLYAVAEPEAALPTPVPHSVDDVRFYAVADAADDTDEDALPAGETENGDKSESDAAVTTATPVPASPALPSPEPTAAVEETPQPEPAPEAAPDAPEDVSVQSYDRTAVPDQINTVIDFALGEWREAANKAFSRAGSKNKYSFWQCGKGPKCNIGWCGAFLGYVFDTCGVPMDEPTKSTPHESGEPYSVRAAGVGKINKGFERMNRLSMVPQPGYLVVYGEQRGYGYKHIGMVTDVDDLGNGVYLLKTVEGNMSNRIKRYCYLFDSNEKQRNTKPCPKEYIRDDGEINDYEHIKKWNITTFCQTWF